MYSQFTKKKKIKKIERMPEKKILLTISNLLKEEKNLFYFWKILKIMLESCFFINSNKLRVHNISKNKLKKRIHAINLIKELTQ